MDVLSNDMCKLFDDWIMRSLEHSHHTAGWLQKCPVDAGASYEHPPLGSDYLLPGALPAGIRHARGFATAGTSDLLPGRLADREHFRRGRFGRSWGSCRRQDLRRRDLVDDSRFLLMLTHSPVLITVMDPLADGPGTSGTPQGEPARAHFTISTDVALRRCFCVR